MEKQVASALQGTLEEPPAPPGRSWHFIMQRTAQRNKAHVPAASSPMLVSPTNQRGV